MCRKQPGTAIGRLCSSCDGKCVICDSLVKPDVLVRICDACDYGDLHGRCIICGGHGVSDAYYCRECVLLEKDRDGTFVFHVFHVFHVVHVARLGLVSAPEAIRLALPCLALPCDPRMHSSCIIASYLLTHAQRITHPNLTDSLSRLPADSQSGCITNRSVL